MLKFVSQKTIMCFKKPIDYLWTRFVASNSSSSIVKFFRSEGIGPASKFASDSNGTYIIQNKLYAHDHLHIEYFNLPPLYQVDFDKFYIY